MKIFEEIKQKKVFSKLPDSIIERVAKINKEDVKESRALLRKYFGVFLTNKILKGKISDNEMLMAHKSSGKRDYEKFYKEIFSEIKNVGSVIDLGCGVNGFSYKYLKEVIGDIDYVGVEATGQLVDHINKYFNKEGFVARVVIEDLFNIEEVLKILKKQKRNRVVFLFQVIDALENLERDFSKKFILEISKECERIILSLSTENLRERRKFIVKRKWLIVFLKENFKIEKDFVMNGERVIIVRKKELRTEN